MNIMPKPRARIVRMWGIKPSYWEVTCGSFRGIGLTIPQALLDWQTQRSFRMFA